MQWYPWLTSYYRQLIHQHQQGYLAPVMLLQAQPGLGLELLIHAVARWLLCLNPNDTKVCGVCHGCKLMAAGNHPDWLQLAAPEGKQSLGVDAIRDTLSQLNCFPAQGKNRVIAIKSAQQLTEASVNALLKTLEEPPANCWFLLSTDTAAILPATLRSRCRLITIPVPAEALGQQWLARHHSLSEQELLSALRLSGGAPGAALQLLSGPLWLQRQQLCETLERALEVRQPIRLLSVLNNSKPTQSLHWLMSLLLDGVKIASGQSLWLSNPDKMHVAELLQQAMTISALLEQLAVCSSCLKTLQLTPAVNTELLLTDVLLHWEKCLS